MTEQYQSPEQTDQAPGEPPTETPDQPAEITAFPDWGYRRKHLIFAIVMILFGLLPRIPLPAFVTNTIGWESLRGFVYDGWIGWPRHNDEVRAVEQGIAKANESGDTKAAEEFKIKLSKMHKPYTDADIRIQRLLGIAVPLLGIAYGLWTWHATRGFYRLSDHTLEIPGHGAIALADIRSIDKTRWERKGIAVVRYQAHHPQRERSFKLDDFAYDRKPTDEILDRLDAYLAPPPEMQDVPQPEQT
jgi:hypothetical protein